MLASNFQGINNAANEAIDCKEAPAFGPSCNTCEYVYNRFIEIL